MTAGRWKRRKYGNRKVECLGESFDSILEKNRWLVLKKWQADGKISGLERQVTFRLTAHQQPICKYIADFTYRIGDREITEDAKGVLTDTFRIKAKLFHAQFGRHIHIVTKQTLQELPA